MKNFARIDGIGKGKIKKGLICGMVLAMCLFMSVGYTQTAEASTQKSNATLSARKSSAKETSGKKAPAKKAPAKKAPEKKTSSKKQAPAKKASAKKQAPAKKATPKKASAKKATAKKSPAKKSAPKKKAVRNSSRKSTSSRLAEQPTAESRLSLYQRGIYSPFGARNVGRRGSRLHKGVDISAPAGSGIVAFESGEVIQSGRDGLYGICVLIKQDDGITARYAHMSSTHLKIGDRVALGETVGKVGRTGRATGTHLHFELIREDGKLLNPAIRLKDGRQLVAAAHTAPGALAYAPQTEVKQPMAVATVEAARKFTESSRLGLVGDFPRQVHTLP